MPVCVPGRLPGAWVRSVPCPCIVDTLAMSITKSITMWATHMGIVTTLPARAGTLLWLLKVADVGCTLVERPSQTLQAACWLLRMWMDNVLAGAMVWRIARQHHSTCVHLVCRFVHHCLRPVHCSPVVRLLLSPLCITALAASPSPVTALAAQLRGGRSMLVCTAEGCLLDLACYMSHAVISRRALCCSLPCTLPC